MKLKLIALQIRAYYKPVVLVMALLIVFGLVAVESVFFTTVSEGEGVVVNYHKLETNTGTKNQLVVQYQGVNAVGKFNGTKLPRKGDNVRVVYQESILLSRPHYFFTIVEEY